MKIAVFTSDRQIEKYPLLTATFIELLRKYWPDCPYPIEVVSNTREPICDVPVFLTGDLPWSDQAIHYLVFQSEPVLIALEDYLICESPNSEAIANCLNIVQSDPNIAFVRLVPWPGPELPSEHVGVGEFCRPTARYLFSLMMTIWNPTHLLRMMPPNMTPWQVELVGTELIREYPTRMLGAESVLINYKNGIKGGRWQPEVQKWLECVLQR